MKNIEFEHWAGSGAGGDRKVNGFSFNPFKKHWFGEPGRVASLLFFVFPCFPSFAIALIFFGPLCPRTDDALFGTLLPANSANSGGARGVPFYIITEDLQAHNFHFRQKYVYIDGGARGVSFYMITDDLEGPAERLFI